MGEGPGVRVADPANPTALNSPHLSLLIIPLPTPIKPPQLPQPVQGVEHPHQTESEREHAGQTHQGLGAVGTARDRHDDDVRANPGPDQPVDQIGPAALQIQATLGRPHLRVCRTVLRPSGKISAQAPLDLRYSSRRGWEIDARSCALCVPPQPRRSQRYRRELSQRAGAYVPQQQQ